MTVKELIDKLSKLQDDAVVKVGYGEHYENINFIFPTHNSIILHPNVYEGNATQLWTETFVFYGKSNKNQKEE